MKICHLCELQVYAKGLCRKHYQAARYVPHPRKAMTDDERKTAQRESMRAATRRYHEKHPDRVKASRAKYYAAHREEQLAKHASYVERNYEKIIAYNAAQRAEKPELYRTYAKKARTKYAAQRLIWGHNRRARKKAQTGKLSNGIADKLLKLQRGQCAVCRVNIRKRFHIDHIVPLARGGENADTNLQLLCPSCNSSKSAKNPIDFMRSRGFLL